MPRGHLTREELLERVRSLSVWTRGEERAPNKPLLLLLALGRLEHGDPRLARFAELEEPLKRLLREFGPPRKQVSAVYPFWYLRNDEVWTVSDAHTIPVRRGGSSPARSELITRDAEGGFTEEAFELLRKDAPLRSRIAGELLQEHFPASLHDEILAEVGLDLRGTTTRSVRDPEFRSQVLRAYSRSCAVCGFDAHMDTGPFGLDAAHVKWKEAYGPDEVGNGLCLCVLHHRAFDRGVFTIDDRLRVLVSANLDANVAAEEHFWKHHEREVRRPQAGYDPPRDEFREWHRREVFRAPARGERRAG